MDDEKESELKTDDGLKGETTFISIQSKLGQSKQEFAKRDLKKMEYFSNRLSGKGRWNDNTMINISSNDINFGVQELEQIIYFKNNEVIKCDYPLKRLPFLCNAFDYFAESIDASKIKAFISNYSPPITNADLTELEKMSQSKCFSLLSEPVASIMEHKNEVATEFNQDIVANWQHVKSSLFVRNAYVASSVFISQFIVLLDGMDFILEFLEFHNSDDLKMVWQYIASNKLWRHYPRIIMAVVKLGHKLFMNDDMETSIDVMAHIYSNYGDDVKALLIDIFYDTFDAICADNTGSFSNISLDSLVQRYWAAATLGSEELTPCEFIITLFCKLLKYSRIKKNEFRLGSHCVNDQIIKCIVHYWLDLSSPECLEFLRKHFAESKEFNLLIDGWTDVLRVLVEMNIDKAFKLTEMWFPLCMDKQKQWIIEELPKQCTITTIEPLIGGICRCYIGDQSKEIPDEYDAFVDKYL